MDALGLYDIYDYNYLPFWHTYAFKVGFVVCVAGLVAFLLYYSVRFFKARKKHDYWNVWHKKLDDLRKCTIQNALFYATIAGVIKECASVKLNSAESLTDLELAFFLKSSDFPDQITKLGEILERAYIYKFDPVYNEYVIQKKELECVTDALHVIQQMEQKK